MRGLFRGRLSIDNHVPPCFHGGFGAEMCDTECYLNPSRVLNVYQANLLPRHTLVSSCCKLPSILCPNGPFLTFIFLSFDSRYLILKLARLIYEIRSHLLYVKWFEIIYIMNIALWSFMNRISSLFNELTSINMVLLLYYINNFYAFVLKS